MQEAGCSPISLPHRRARAMASPTTCSAIAPRRRKRCRRPARACESIADLRDPAAAPAWFLRIVTTMCLRTLRRRRLRRRLFGWLPGKEGDADAAPCLLYTSDAADERSSVDLGG